MLVNLPVNGSRWERSPVCGEDLSAADADTVEARIEAFDGGNGTCDRVGLDDKL